MTFTDISFPTTKENILFDEALLLSAEDGSGGEVLRFWESGDTAVVLGRIGRWEEDIDVDAVKKDDIPVLRRASGGGTVVQGAGCLNFSLIIAKDRDPGLNDLKKSYQIILSHIIEALKVQGFNAEFKPVSDLAEKNSEKKFSGNAQKRGRKFILHHGTILYDFDLDKISRYLRIPKDVPEYRRGRTHRDFVTNLPVSVEQLKSDLAARFKAGPLEAGLSRSNMAKLLDFVQNKDVTVKLTE